MGEVHIPCLIRLVCFKKSNPIDLVFIFTLPDKGFPLIKHLLLISSFIALRYRVWPKLLLWAAEVFVSHHKVNWGVTLQVNGKRRRALSIRRLMYTCLLHLIHY